jgi:prephenate dehydratase
MRRRPEIQKTLLTFAAVTTGAGFGYTRRMPSYDAAFQGSRGAFSEIAAWELLGPEATLLPCPHLEEVFGAVLTGTARYGVVPVENTLAGSVLLGVDLLIQYDLYVIGEAVCRIEHAVIGAPGVRLEDVRLVMSHPVALAQCETFFRNHPEIRAVPEYDTAGAVEKVVRENRRDCAAIAGSRTAEIFGGVVLADKIQDHSENYTRFLLVSRETREVDDSVRNKTTIVVKLANNPGSLFHSLRPFAERGIDLTKIESRPIKSSPFEYLFFVDLVSEPGRHSVVFEAVEELKRLSASVRPLGTYPMRQQGRS